MHLRITHSTSPRPLFASTNGFAEITKTAPDARFVIWSAVLCTSYVGAYVITLWASTIVWFQCAFSCENRKWCHFCRNCSFFPPPKPVKAGILETVYFDALFVILLQFLKMSLTNEILKTQNTFPVVGNYCVQLFFLTILIFLIGLFRLLNNVCNYCGHFTDKLLKFDI